MEQETVPQEVVLEKVRQRLGSLDNKAEQAVAEAIAILNEARQTLPQQEDEFVSANVSVAQYVAWSPEERFQYLNNAEKVNTRWVERQLQKLNAAWLMVIDGGVVAHGTSIQSLPREQEFNALCDKYGKYPFVFFNQREFMIEEGTVWHSTKDPEDAYPTIGIKLRGGSGETTILADFDTGAKNSYFDLDFLRQRGLLTIGARDHERASVHLGQNFRFFTKPLMFSLADNSGMLRELELFAYCIKNWHTSPFVDINPNRTALVGREPFLRLAPIIHLDFAARQTEIEFRNSDGT
jgi:hypothetical protein